MAAVDVESYPEQISLNTGLESHELSTAELRTEQNFELSVDKESTISFVCEWDNGRVARILLSLINDSPYLMDWKLRCNCTMITAFPSSSGYIGPHGEGKCLLVWICPDYMETWQQMERAKLLFSFDLITNNSKIVGSANIRFLTQLDMNEFCTPNNPPVHNLIIGFDKTLLSRKQSELSLQTALEVTEIMPQDQTVARGMQISHSHDSVSSSRSSMINFALDRFHDDVAYVQLDLVNNSKRQAVWKLKTNNECISALPSGSGLVPAHRSGKCILSWQLPENCHSWDRVGSAKLLMSTRIYTRAGKLLGEEIAKFIVQPNVDQLCTADNPPIHQLVLVSEKAQDNKMEPLTETASGRVAPRETSSVTTKIKSNTAAPKTVFENEQIVWQIGVICCAAVLSYLVLKVLLTEDFSF